jgi:cytoskeletal protein RodZ
MNMAEHPLPDDERLCRLINEAYEYLPGPDMSRLSRLQERLIRQASGRRPRYRPRRLSWWVALLLVSGAAAAAWWTGLVPFRDQAAGPTEPRQVRPPEPTPAPEQKDEPPPPSADHPEEDSPVIYQREGFQRR